MNWSGSRFAVVGILGIVIGSGVTLRAASKAEVGDGIERAATFLKSISTHGGYAGIYSLDLQERFGEGLYERAALNEIWIQPPGTPSVGAVFLRLFRVTQDQVYLTLARDAGRALAFGQRREGGWDHRADVAGLTAATTEFAQRSGSGSFDDRITQGALSFLMDLDRELDEPWLDAALERGLNFVMRAQYANGGWPQWFPLRGRYHDYHTFNDRAINDCVELMWQAYEQYGREAYRASAIRGGEFILASRLAPPQAGWAQQYSLDLKPAWARRFEPPGVCSAVTVNNIETLLQLYVRTGESRFLVAIPDALSWLEASQLSAKQISKLKFPNQAQRETALWARLYEVGTNRPIYGDREVGDAVFYDLDAISARERNSYGWQGTYGVQRVRRKFRELETLGPEAWRAKQQAAMARERTVRAVPATELRTILESQRSDGSWVTDGRLQIGTFVAHLNRFADALEAFEEAR